MYGDFSGMTSVPADMTIIGVFAAVAMGAAAKARGVRPKPARISAWSLVDELLGKTFGCLRGIGIVAQEHLDLPAGDHIAVLRNIKLNGRVDLLPRRCHGTRHGQDKTDFQRLLRLDSRHRQHHQRQGKQSDSHAHLPAYPHHHEFPLFLVDSKLPTTLL